MHGCDASITPAEHAEWRQVEMLHQRHGIVSVAIEEVRVEISVRRPRQTVSLLMGEMGTHVVVISRLTQVRRERL